MWRARYRSLHAGQECDARKHKWHLCFRSASELETGANHFLVAARVDSELKQACPIFSELPEWGSAWSSPQSWGDN